MCRYVWGIGDMTTNNDVDVRFSGSVRPGSNCMPTAPSLTSFHLRSLKSLLELLLKEVEFLQTFTLEKSENATPVSLVSRLEMVEIELIRNALRHTGGNQVRAAKLLDLRSNTLNAKMKRFGIDPRLFARAANGDDADY
jgi:transcriptional regulator with GAF, ATPase, and Fis domain